MPDPLDPDNAMLQAIILSALLLASSARAAAVIPSEQKNYVQSVRIVAIDTSPAPGGIPSENKTYVLDVKTFGVIPATGISSSCASGYYLDNGTWVDGLTTGGNCSLSGSGGGSAGICVLGDGAFSVVCSTSAGNLAGGDNSVDSGGSVNKSSGTYSTVAGGQNNVATGDN